MARSIRIQAAGAFYHAMARGNRRENIFHEHDDDRYHHQTLMDYIHLNPVRAGIIQPKAGCDRQLMFVMQPFCWNSSTVRGRNHARVQIPILRASCWRRSAFIRVSPPVRTLRFRQKNRRNVSPFSRRAA